MPIDFSYLDGAAPQEKNAPIEPNAANVTVRVDADSMLLCDGDYIDQPFKAGALTKIQLPIGQHLLEFLYTEDPDIKVEKEVDFPEAGKSYLVIIKGLKDLVDAAAEEAKRKAEEEARVKAAEVKRKATEEEAKRIAALREPYVALSNNNQILTFYFDHLKSDRNGMNLDRFNWVTYRRDVITVIFDESFANYHDTCSTWAWFFDFTKLTSVLGLNNFDTSKVTNMSGMFQGCTSLKTLDLSSFDTSKVTDMHCMFDGCASLTKLDLRGFGTGNVTDMRRMFKDCKSLKTLDISSFDTSKVTSMRCMFYGCKSLKALDLSSFKTKNVTDMKGMFACCQIDFPESKFNKDEVLDIFAAL